MINIFNRALLFQDTDAQACERVRNFLKEAGIEYKVIKEKSGPSAAAVRIPRTGRTGSMGVDSYSNSYMSGGVPDSWTRGGSTDTLCKIYVMKKDLDKAKKICDIE